MSEARPSAYPRPARMGLPETIVEAGRRLRNGSLTVLELTQGYLARAKAMQPVLHAFITVMEDYALATAAHLDAELHAGKDRGPLHGIPITLKDNISFAGVPATVGSKYFKDRIPTEDAAIVTRLKAAGAVCLGKSNMGEFGTGAHGQNRTFGDIRNPWNLERTPGGSSNGTAVAVAAGVCLGGVGTDASGSLRNPACRVGIVGLRATDGRVSLAGVWPRTRTLGGGGPLARTAHDAALLLNAIAGHDPDYPRSLNLPYEDFSTGLDSGVRGLRLGVIEYDAFCKVDPAIATAIESALKIFNQLGASIRKVRIPLLAEPGLAQELFQHILLYEFNQILGPLYLGAKDRDLAFGLDVKRNLATGRRVTRRMYFRAMKKRQALAGGIKLLFKNVDALLAPTLPDIAPPSSSTPATWARGRRLTQPFSFSGLPAISIPCGFGPGNLPIGLQIVANEAQEKLLLRIAATFENNTDDQKQYPRIPARRDPTKGA